MTDRKSSEKTLSNAASDAPAHAAAPQATASVTPPTDDVTGAAAVRPDLPPAALRALAEAEERRRSAAALALPPELGGRDGPEPVRYGDYEKNGLAVDF